LPRGGRRGTLIRHRAPARGRARQSAGAGRGLSRSQGLGQFPGTSARACRCCGQTRRGAAGAQCRRGAVQCGARIISGDPFRRRPRLCPGRFPPARRQRARQPRSDAARGLL